MCIFNIFCKITENKTLHKIKILIFALLFKKYDKQRENTGL